MLALHLRQGAVPSWITDGLAAHAAAREKQRQEQQGLGLPIISVLHEGVRYVRVGDRVMSSKESHWNTFTSFLRSYATVALGRDWLDRERAKSVAERHPMIEWFERASVRDAAGPQLPKDSMGFVPSTGAITAIVHLSYDLYCLAHNIELQAKLLERLRKPEQFRGARYEVLVAAALLRAGYHVEFENEDDRSQTHCEFTARAPGGKLYSVEAKHRQHEPGAKSRLRLGKLLSKALKKRATHTRLVFIETNLPDVGPGARDIEFFRNAIRDVRRLQEKQHPDVSAYLVVTNTPFALHLDETGVHTAICVDGFGIRDFGFDIKISSFRENYRARAAHKDIFDLATALNRDRDVPVTFNGDTPELVYTSRRRLTIGNTYMVPDYSGRSTKGLLVDGIVVAEQGNALCIFRMSEGEYYLHTVPLSEAELAAHEAHPDTFFGTIRTPTVLGKSSTELFEHFLSKHRKSAKEDLIRCLVEAKEGLLGELSDLDHEELALRYSAFCTLEVIHRRGKSPAAHDLAVPKGPDSGPSDAD